jgi:hypothetical protein
MKTKDRWQPVLKRGLYCSPACGRGCTKKEYDRLRQFGRRIAAGLGSGWMIRMHENLGWFMEVISPCGRIRVGPDYDYNKKKAGLPKLCGYYANITEPNDLGILYSAHQDTPLEAVRVVIKNAQDDLRKRGAAIVDPAMLKHLGQSEGEKVAVTEDTHFQFMGCRILVEVPIGPGENEAMKTDNILAKWRKFLTTKTPDSVERRS